MTEKMFIFLIALISIIALATPLIWRYFKLVNKQDNNKRTDYKMGFWLFIIGIIIIFIWLYQQSFIQYDLFRPLILLAFLSILTSLTIISFRSFLFCLMGWISFFMFAFLIFTVNSLSEGVKATADGLGMMIAFAGLFFLMSFSALCLKSIDILGQKIIEK